MNNKQVIKKQIELLRSGYHIGIYPEYIPLLCNECDLENFKFACVNNIGYNQINLEKLGINKPFHKASLLGFNTENASEWFLLDPTYGQFFKNEVFKNYMINNYKDFSLELLNQGFIECNMENIKCYFNGFIYSNAFTNNIDYDLVNENITTLFYSNNIIKKRINRH